MRPMGFVQDGKGRRIFALVPVAQTGTRVARRMAPARPSTEVEADTLTRLFQAPFACLEMADGANPLRVAREGAGLTQAELAFVLGISQPMLSRQEQPFRRLRPATIRRTLEALRRIQENRGRPELDLEALLVALGPRLAESAARKPRDPVERRLLQEAGDPVAAREKGGRARKDGARPRPSR